MTTTLPRISIVTPNYNQALFLERTLASVLDQNYPDLEYIVIDGGSGDGSVPIIERYADRLSHWESAPDKGQYDAVKKGFSHASGEVMGWINSDDIYLPWTLRIVGEIFRDCPQIDWITSTNQVNINEDDIVTSIFNPFGFSTRSFFDGRHKGFGFRNAGVIQQESTFWRRTLWDKAGSAAGQKTNLAGDFELWSSFFSNAEITCVTQPLAAFRIREGQRSQVYSQQYRIEVEQTSRRVQRPTNLPTTPYMAVADIVKKLTQRRPRSIVSKYGYMAQYVEKKNGKWAVHSHRFL